MTHIDHLEHIEDLPVLNGFSGAIQACSYLRTVVDWLGYCSRTSPNQISIKYDGSFSFVAGWIEDDFFVSTKSIFNETPIYYTHEDQIDASHHSPDLKMRLRLLFAYLPEIIPDGHVYQGDFMYTPADIKRTIIDGTDTCYIQPNTIAYAFHPELLPLYERPGIGVAIHTRYEPYEGSPRRLQLHPEQPNLDAAGSDIMLFQTRLPEQHYQFIDSYFLEGAYEKLSFIERYIGQNADILNEWSHNQDLGRLYKQWMNACACRKTDAPFEEWLSIHYADERATRKTEAGRRSLDLHYKSIVSLLDNKFWQVYNVIILGIQQLKDKLVYHLDARLSQQRCYFLSENGVFTHTFGEGYVARRPDGSDAVKLVNRREFSRMNALRWKK
jgi:hypothetical protein